MHRIVTGLTLALGLVAASVANANAQVYGYTSPLPSGSYQQSCVDAQMRGTTLSASCRTTNGQQAYSSLNVSRCNGDIANTNGRLTCSGGYYNGGYNNGGYNNGGYYGRSRGDDDDDNSQDGDRGKGHHHHPHGKAHGYYNNGPGSNNGGYNNGGYNNGGYNLPAGSYQQSCTNARMNGSLLTASCTAVNGSWINSSLDTRRCSQSTDIYNRNGYLGC